MRLRASTVRFALIAAIVAFGTWLRASHSPAAASAREWTRVCSPRAIHWIGISAAVLLGLYLIGILWLLLNPWRRRSPDEAMGIGCAWLIAACVAGIEAVLVIGLIFQLRPLILFLAAPTLLLSIPIVGGLIAESIKAWKARRARLAVFEQTKSC